MCILSCQKAQKSLTVRIGLPQEPKSLNIWLASDANSRKILDLIYQPLYTRDPATLELIPWLASEQPVFSSDKLTCTIKLKKAKWSDGSGFTARDVVFTRKMFFDFKIPRYYSKWKVVKDLQAPDDHTLVFHLKHPSAIFLSRALTAPIVSEKEWKAVAQKALKTEKPLRFIQDYAVEKPLGTGPFSIFEYKRGSYIYMKKNPWFFASGETIAGHRLGPYLDNILFKFFGTSDVAILALKKGEIDFYWWEIQPGYIKDLKNQNNIKIFFNKKSALYYMGFNVRKPPFSDRTLRQAIAMLINKEFILTRILQNYGTPMHSIVPSGNSFWYNPDVEKYGYGKPYDLRIKEAYNRLRAAGYTWQIPPVDSDGNIVKAEGMKLPSGDPMGKIVILTPPADYDPKRAFAGTMIQEWLRNMGMPVFARPMSFNSLIDAVKGKHQFDAFILGYGRLNLDPDYLRAFFYSANDRPRGWNMSGYKNPYFDRIADEQRRLTDVYARRRLIMEMQKILMRDVPYIPLYNPKIIEAVCTDRFSGWVEQVNGIGNIWSLCMIRPE
jgi:ABC-type transport system substrate-binding protein